MLIMTMMRVVIYNDADVDDKDDDDADDAADDNATRKDRTKVP